jgi:hypothetical protein
MRSATPGEKSAAVVAAVGVGAGDEGTAEGAGVLPFGMARVGGPFLRLKPSHLRFHFLVVLGLEHEPFLLLPRQEVNVKKGPGG